MESRNYKAIDITVKSRGGRASLTEAFNDWNKSERPANILNVHYYHDPEAHERGYLVVFEEASKVAARRESADTYASHPV